MMHGCEKRRGFGLLMEQLGDAGRQQSLGQDLDRDLAFEGFLVGDKNHGHGAVVQLVQQAGRTHRLTDQVVEIHRLYGSHDLISWFECRRRHWASTIPPKSLSWHRRRPSRCDPWQIADIIPTRFASRLCFY